MKLSEVVAEKKMKMKKESGLAFEQGLPPYLQQDLDAYKEALIHGSSLLDCLWCELYGSINSAEITDGAITHDHAQYLRKKFLWGTEQDETIEDLIQEQGYC